MGTINTCLPGVNHLKKVLDNLDGKIRDQNRSNRATPGKCFVRGYQGPQNGAQAFDERLVRPDFTVGAAEDYVCVRLPGP